MALGNHKTLAGTIKRKLGPSSDIIPDSLCWCFSTVSPTATLVTWSWHVTPDATERKEARAALHTADQCLLADVNRSTSCGSGILEDFLLLSLPNFYDSRWSPRLRTMCRRIQRKKWCGSASPVEGCWVPLGLAAEHHLSSVLAGMKWEHHTARLFGERGPQQDSTSCTEKQQSSISFDVAVDLETNFHIHPPPLPPPLFSRFPRLPGRRVRKEEAKCKTVQMKKKV